MPVAVTWDTVQDAEASASARQGVRIVRTGLVTGLTNATTTPAKALLTAIIEGINDPGIATYGVEHPNLSTAKLTFLNARGINATMARLWALYETPAFNGAPIESFAVEDGISLQSADTQRFPVTQQPLLCSLTAAAPDVADLGTTTKIITANYPYTMRSLVLYGLFAERPSPAMMAAGRHLNSTEWQGLPVGFWRCEGVRSRWSNRDGLYAVVAPFLSKVEEDWSTYEFAKDPNTGEFILGDLATEQLVTLATEDYAYGPVFDIVGIFKAGFYPLANFSAIFDALISNTPLDPTNIQPDGIADR